MSPFTLAAHLCALRFEVGDMQFAYSRAGITDDEMSRLTAAIDCMKQAEEHLKAFRFIKKVEDLPEAEKKPSKTAKK